MKKLEEEVHFSLHAPGSLSTIRSVKFISTSNLIRSELLAFEGPDPGCLDSDFRAQMVRGPNSSMLSTNFLPVQMQAGGSCTRQGQGGEKRVARGKEKAHGGEREIESQAGHLSDSSGDLISSDLNAFAGRTSLSSRITVMFSSR